MANRTLLFIEVKVLRLNGEPMEFENLSLEAKVSDLPGTLRGWLDDVKTAVAVNFHELYKTKTSNPVAWKKMYFPMFSRCIMLTHGNLVLQMDIVPS